MLLILTEDDRGRTYLLQKDREDLTILGHPCSLFRQDEKWYLRIPSRLKADRKNPIRENMAVTVTDHDGNNEAHLYFLQTPEGFAGFRRFRYPEQEFTIGSAVEDDINIDLPQVLPHAFAIDPQNRKIRYVNGLHTGMHNGKIIADEAEYCRGDRFEFMGLRILFHDDFLMINSFFPLSDSFVFFHARMKSQILPARRNILFSNDLPAVQEAVTECPLKVPQLPEENFSSHLLLSMGPAMMMASASLAAGMMNGYRNYMAGRSYIDIIPGILLPSVMLLSALLFNPLQRLSEKKQRKRKREKICQEFAAEIEQFTMNVKRQNDLYNDYARSAVMQPDMCEMEWLDNNSIFIHHDRSVFLYFGRGRNVMEIRMQQPLVSHDSKVREMISGIFRTVGEIDNTAVIFDLSVYRRIVIENDDGQLLCLSLSTLYCMYPELSICVLNKTEDGVINLLLREAAGADRQGQRLLFRDEEELQGYLKNCKEEMTCVIALSSAGEIETGKNLSVLYFETESGRHSCDLRVHMEGQKAVINDQLKHRILETKLDKVKEKDILLRYAVPYRRKNGLMQKDGGFLSMLGVRRYSELRISEQWQANENSRDLRCVIGVSPQGEKIWLDLDENCHGPHGLVAGTTGSGKSELLLSMILSLAVRYPPSRLQFSVIDFKGGSGFQSLLQKDMQLPHMASLLSDLDVDDMKRALFSLHDLLKQRETCFSRMSRLSHSPIANLKEYRRFYRSDMDLPELADIVLIVDEFAELKRSRPDFLDELVRIARLGRSLGLHLILATQKPGGIVTDQIWSNIGFRICLKVAEKQDSAEMVHCPDAVYLTQPGSFIMASGEQLQYGRCGYLHKILQNTEKHAVILDDKGSVKEQIAETEEGITEFAGVLKMLYENAQEQKTAMWLKPVPDLYAKKEFWEKGILALLDDYEEGQYRKVPALTERTGFHAVLSADIAETVSFLKALILAIMTSEIPADEMYLINDFPAGIFEEAETAGVLNNCLKTSQEEKIGNLFARMKLTDGKRRVLIISDLSHFYQSDVKNREHLSEILHGGGRSHVDLWLAMRSSSLLNYREQTLITDFWCLKNDSSNEIQSFLQMPHRERLHRTGHGLCRQEKVLDFAWFQVNDQMLKEEFPAGSETEDIYRLPYMKEDLSPDDCPYEGTALGMLYGSYEWYMANENTVVAAGFEDELEDLKKHLSGKENISFVLWRDVQRNESVYRRKDVLLIREAAKEYSCYMQNGVQSEKDGILIRGSRKEVIRLVV